MKIFLDTNILFSAILFPDSTPDKALQKALLGHYKVITCDYVLDELYRNILKKFPNKINALKNFYKVFKSSIKVIKINSNISNFPLKLRDEKDIPVLKAAIVSKSDILITGDKDFLESGIKDIKIITASQFYYDY